MQYRVIKAHLNKISELEQEAGLKDVALKWLAPVAVALQTAFSALPAEAAKLDMVHLEQQLETKKNDANALAGVLSAAFDSLNAAYAEEKLALKKQINELQSHKGSRKELDDLRTRIFELSKSQWPLDNLHAEIEKAQIGNKEQAALREDDLRLKELAAKVQKAKAETRKSAKEAVDLVNLYLERLGEEPLQGPSWL